MSIDYLSVYFSKQEIKKMLYFRKGGSLMSLQNLGKLVRNKLSNYEWEV